MKTRTLVLAAAALVILASLSVPGSAAAQSPAALPMKDAVPAAQSSAIDGVWMVTGGPGAKGDCMSEFALQWDARWDPASSYHCKHPEFGTSGNAGRVSPGQVCTDGDGCDRDVDVFGYDVPGQCTFKVGVCFCVDDPAMPTVPSRSNRSLPRSR